LYFGAEKALPVKIKHPTMDKITIENNAFFIFWTPTFKVNYKTVYILIGYRTPYVGIQPDPMPQLR
jgi:hypothetical protein